MTKKIKWILIDVGGVAVRFTFTNLKGYLIGNRWFDQKQLEAVYFSKEYIDYMLDIISHETFISGFIKNNKLDLTIDEFNELFVKDIFPTEGLENLIAKLSKKYSIALATNEGRIFSRHKIDGSKIRKYANKIITSYDIKEIKPSINFFKKTLKILKAEPEECVFIDDDIKNIQAAQSLGITSILFKNTEQLKGELKRLKFIE